VHWIRHFAGGIKPPVLLGGLEGKITAEKVTAKVEKRELSWRERKTRETITEVNENGSMHF